MNLENLRLLQVKAADRFNYIKHLLLADESEQVVMSYLHDGELYAVDVAGETVGVMLFIFPQASVVELKNIALIEKYRGQGLGKEVITKAVALYQEKGFEKMIVGTANSSIANLAFYQKAGFRMIGVKRDFFLKYPEPIYEAGIQAVDMIMFEKWLV